MFMFLISFSCSDCTGNLFLEGYEIWLQAQRSFNFVSKFVLHIKS